MPGHTETPFGRPGYKPLRSQFHSRIPELSGRKYTEKEVEIISPKPSPEKFNVPVKMKNGKRVCPKL
jgi:hypothetical protein